MKKILLVVGIIVMVIATRVAFGQQATEGVITYEIRINNHRTLPPDREGMKAMIPEYRTFKQQLFYNTEASLFKPLIEEEDEEEGDGRMRMRFRMRQETYTEHGSSRIVTLQDFMGKNYLITDTVKVDPWKFGTETKTIMGLACKQAFYTNEERKQVITAWYTDQLRPFLGPEKFNTLPGAILAVDINNGERVLVAIKVEARQLKKNELKEPVNGEKITQADLRKLQEERMKSFRGGGGGGGGGGGQTIIIRN